MLRWRQGYLFLMLFFIRFSAFFHLSPLLPAMFYVLVPLPICSFLAFVRYIDIKKKEENEKGKEGERPLSFIQCIVPWARPSPLHSLDKAVSLSFVILLPLPPLFCLAWSTMSLKVTREEKIFERWVFRRKTEKKGITFYFKPTSF